MRRLKAILWKEVLHILRDPRTLMMIIMMPAMQLTIYGYAINTDVKHIRSAVFDEDRSPLSRRLVQAFEQSAYFDFREHARSQSELQRMLDRGDAKAALHIPPDFAKDLLAGRNALLQLLVDGTDSNPANTALNTSQAIVIAFMQKENLVPAAVAPVDFRPRLWYNPDLKSVYFMVPGLVGLLLQVLIPMITATAIVREKERGNIEQLLVTPIRRWELMLGKLIPYVGIGMVIALLIVTAARFLFSVPIRGNLFTLMATSFLFLSVCLGVGLFASTVANNQQQAAQMVMFLVPPSILLSGFIFPRESMPRLIYYLSFGIPLTYYLTIVRGIILKGLGWMDLWKQILPLVVMSIGVLTMSVLKFRKRLS
ncbi:MAG TPA: ABC transporter permease [bacterium]|nr:ABC transporter permease [bacterium]